MELNRHRPARQSRATVHRTYRGTIFYPLGDADDRVTAVGPVRPVRFQRVLPRYELSTNASRDTGLGPLFDAHREWDVPIVGRRPGRVARKTAPRARLPLHVGKQFDRSV